jgi:hypothetical protein
MKQTAGLFCLLPAIWWFTLQHGRWRRHVTPTRWLICTVQHDIVSQKINILLINSVRISNPTLPPYPLPKYLHSQIYDLLLEFVFQSWSPVSSLSYFCCTSQKINFYCLMQSDFYSERCYCYPKMYQSLS